MSTLLLFIYILYFKPKYITLKIINIANFKAASSMLVLFISWLKPRVF
nr:MAG TPA: hypothetical protein [Caudoviricetes sp.]